PRRRACREARDERAVAVAVTGRVVRERRQVDVGEDPVAEVRSAGLDARVDEGDRRGGADGVAAASAVSVVVLLSLRSLRPELADADGARPELTGAEAVGRLVAGVEDDRVVRRDDEPGLRREPRQIAC